jgi:hypothetical protein
VSSKSPGVTPWEQAPGLEAEIVACALDYYEGWFDGNAARMERALHPELVKRSLADDGSGMDTMTAEEMIAATAAGRGKERDAAIGGDRRIEVSSVDIHGNVAAVTVRSSLYVDYLQLARTREGWKIVNVLWDWT